MAISWVCRKAEGIVGLPAEEERLLEGAAEAGLLVAEAGAGAAVLAGAVDAAAPVQTRKISVHFQRVKACDVTFYLVYEFDTTPYGGEAKNNKRPRKSSATTTDVKPDNGGALPLRRSSRIAERRSIKRARGDGDGEANSGQLSGEMPDEMVLEVLARLPVKPLLRLRAVSRPWRAAISAAHLRRSAATHRREPTLLIAPQLLDDAERDIVWPTNFSDTIRLHQWQRRQMEEEQDGAGASLIFRRSFHGEFREIVGDTPYPVLVWHTATSFRGALFFTTCHDTAARPPQESRLLRLCLRDETFSVVALPPPCRPPFLHEAFHLSELNGVMCLAHAAGVDDDGTSSSLTSSSVVIWMTEDGVSPPWSKRCVFRSTSMFIPIAPFHHGGGGGVIGKRGDLLFFLVSGGDGDGEDEIRIGEGKEEEEKQVVCLNGMRYHDDDDEQGRHTVVVGSSWENLHYYKVIPYSESLVPIYSLRFFLFDTVDFLTHI
uniref:F-box domain-containing protein n=1 Tax=Oryza meridionalis TaxID=40149 RepID=A0A0E0D110_9ORYZ